MDFAENTMSRDLSVVLHQVLVEEEYFLSGDDVQSIGERHWRKVSHNG